jgi:hypothetical protein
LQLNQVLCGQFVLSQPLGRTAPIIAWDEIPAVPTPAA